MELSPHVAQAWSGETWIGTQTSKLLVLHRPHRWHGVDTAAAAMVRSGSKSGHRQVSVLAIISTSRSRLSTADFDYLTNRYKRAAKPNKSDIDPEHTSS